MSRRPIFAFLLLILFSGVFSACSVQVTQRNPAGAEIKSPLENWQTVPGSYLVRSAQLSRRQVDTLEALENRNEVKIRRFENLKIWNVSATEKAVDSVVQTMKSMPSEPDYFVKVEPSEALEAAAARHSWNQYSSDLQSSGGGTALADLSCKASAALCAQPVRISVIDTAARLSHDMLRGQIVDPIFVGADPNAPATNMHGTHVMSTVVMGRAMMKRNGLSTAVSSRIQIQSINLGYENGFKSSDLIDGFSSAISSGARVVSASLGGYSYSQAMRDVINQLAASDILLVNAAGNEGYDPIIYPSFPGHFPLSNVLSITSVNEAAGDSSFSNLGYLSAIGEYVYAASIESDSAYAAIRGTSMATPVAASVAGLLRALRPDLDATSIRGLLLATAQRKGGQVKPYFGMMDISKAARLSQSSLPRSNGGLSVSVTSHDFGRVAQRAVKTEPVELSIEVRNESNSDVLLDYDMSSLGYIIKDLRGRRLNQGQSIVFKTQLDTVFFHGPNDMESQVRLKILGYAISSPTWTQVFQSPEIRLKAIVEEAPFEIVLRDGGVRASDGLPTGNIIGDKVSWGSVPENLPNPEKYFFAYYQLDNTANRYDVLSGDFSVAACPVFEEDGIFAYTGPFGGPCVSLHPGAPAWGLNLYVTPTALRNRRGEQSTDMMMEYLRWSRGRLSYRYSKTIKLETDITDAFEFPSIQSIRYYTSSGLQTLPATLKNGQYDFSRIPTDATNISLAFNNTYPANLGITVGTTTYNVPASSVGNVDVTSFVRGNPSNTVNIPLQISYFGDLKGFCYGNVANCPHLSKTISIYLREAEAQIPDAQLTIIAPTTAYVGTRMLFTLRASSQINIKKWSFGVATQSNALIDVDAKTFEVAYERTFLVANGYVYTFTVVDERGRSFSKNVSINVLPALNTQPTVVFTTPLPAQVYLGTATNLSASASDVEGLLRLRIRLKTNENTEWASLSDAPKTAALDYRHTFNQLGTVTFVAEAEDTGSPKLSALPREITVTVVNAPPTVAVGETCAAGSTYYNNLFGLSCGTCQGSCWSRSSFEGGKFGAIPAYADEFASCPRECRSAQTNPPFPLDLPARPVVALEGPSSVVAGTSNFYKASASSTVHIKQWRMYLSGNPNPQWTAVNAPSINNGSGLRFVFGSPGPQRWILEAEDVYGQISQTELAVTVQPVPSVDNPTIPFPTIALEGPSQVYAEETKLYLARVTSTIALRRWRMYLEGNPNPQWTDTTATSASNLMGTPYAFMSPKTEKWIVEAEDSLGQMSRKELTVLVLPKEEMVSNPGSQLQPADSVPERPSIIGASYNTASIFQGQSINIVFAAHDNNGDLARMALQIWKTNSVNNQDDYIGQIDFTILPSLQTQHQVNAVLNSSDFPNLVPGVYYIRFAAIDQKTFDEYPLPARNYQWSQVFRSFTVQAQ